MKFHRKKILVCVRKSTMIEDYCTPCHTANGHLRQQPAQGAVTSSVDVTAFSLLAVLGSRLCQGCSEIQSGLLNAEIRNKTCIALVELNLQELCCSSGGDWMTLIFHPTQGSYQQITPIMSQGFLKTERKRGIIEPENLWKDS